jgi:hypothetical protein
VPSPSQIGNDETRHDAAKADTAHQGNQINTGPPPTFVKKKDVRTNSSGETFGSCIGEGADYSSTDKAMKFVGFGTPNAGSEGDKGYEKIYGSFAKIESGWSPKEILVSARL